MDDAPPPERLADARSALLQGAAALGISLTSDQTVRFERYAALLREGKRSLSLTALTDPVDVAVKHFLDSLSVLPALPDGHLRLIDVGTGAGFPGVPLALVRPHTAVVLLEATEKKAAWLSQTLRRLEIPNATVLTGRAETLAHSAAHRATYDVAVARALAPLATLCELCLPFLRAGGRLIAQKSAAGAGVEVPAAERAIGLLGGTPPAVLSVPLSVLPNRVLVVVEQAHSSPLAYPRRPGMPAKRPL